MSTAELTKQTAEDLLNMPDGERYELVDGQLVELEMGGLSSWIGGQVYKRLDGHAKGGENGWAFPADAGIQCFPADSERVRKPDAFFVSRGRLENEQIPVGFVRVVPDVAAEVISPNDQYYAVDQKVDEYLEAGIRLVWVVNPSSRTVMVYRSRGGDPSRLTDRDELSGEDVLPGFSCPIADLFPAAEGVRS